VHLFVLLYELLINALNNICAQQADDTQNYKNIKEQPYKTNTSNLFNRLCRTYCVIPATYDFTYALL